LNFLAAYGRPEVETYYRKNRASDFPLMPLLTLVIHRHALRRGKGELRRIDGPVLLGFQLIAAALIVLFHGAELINGAVLADVNGELLQVAVIAFWHQHKVVTILFNIILLPV